MIWFRKWMILTHRWMGIVLSPVFLMWFVSGIAIMYAREMPTLTPETRLERLPALDLAAVRLSPAEAVEKAELESPPGRATLLTIMNRPAYRFAVRRDQVTVFADTGEVLVEVTDGDALKIASRFINLPEDKLHHTSVLNKSDQWTIGESGAMPLHKITVDDEARTELYVSEPLGEVAVLTTRGGRLLAWIAAIPHWMYFAPLRLNNELWRQVVLWASGVGAIFALIGIIVGIIQFSISKPHIPYAGWMRWHYITGAVFGIFTLTWVFSGLLSMEPWFWASVGGTGDDIPAALAGGRLDLATFPKVEPGAWTEALAGHAAKEVEFRRIQGQPYYVVRGADPEPLLVAANPLQIRREPFSTESLLSLVKEGNPDVPIVDSQMMSDFDSYYHARDQKPPLPVLRVKFGDPDSTWFYIDPGMSRVVARFTRRERLQRWIYHGFHSMDFSFWYYNRPLWDIGMITLLVGGIASSGIGLYIGLKRVMRHLRRFARMARAGN